MLLADLPADLPLLLFATADAPQTELDSGSSALFGHTGQTYVYELERPTGAERAVMFEGLFSQIFRPATQKADKVQKLPPPKVLTDLYRDSTLKVKTLATCILVELQRPDRLSMI